jgi:hypothetical protein
MYPLTIVSLLAAAANDRHVARYLLPLPLVGAGVSVYHLLVENHVVGQTTACLISAPGGCATKWIEEFGYVTIPVLSLTGFALCFAFLLLGALPLPLVGAGVSVYHLLVENGVVGQSSACLISAPGGCATKWIEEFGYVTIPVLALTGFALCFEFLLLGALPPVRAATVEER